jgi:hypothetical protein
MARACSICTHPGKDAIERDLLGTTPLLRIAKNHRVAESSLRRHRDLHLAPKLANALARREDVSAERLVSWATGLYELTLFELVRAKSERDRNGFRALLSEARKNLELVGRMAGVLDPVQVHVDARQQTAILAGMSEAELRALAAGAETVDLAPVRRELEAA